jgi:glucokinase
MNEIKKVTAGVDIGGTNTAIGFVDENGNLLLDDLILTSPEEGADKFVIRLSEKIKLMNKQLMNGNLLCGIGIAAPSANYFLGTIESPSNLKWGKINFKEMMYEYFDIPIAITNDANAAAIGEQAFGCAKKMKNFILITLGTGLGSGIVVDGNILYGERGLAGELGHTIVETNGRECNCGRMGCLETYVSATGIRRTAFNLLCSLKDESELRDISYNSLTGKMICELAVKGDPIALKTFEVTGEILGKALANAAAAFSPEAIILFGGLADARDLILAPTRKYFKKNLLNIYNDNIKILLSHLQNSKAAVLGASNLILKEITNNSYNNISNKIYLEKN